MPKESISPAQKKLMDKARQINKIQSRLFSDLEITYKTTEVTPENTKAFIREVAIFAATELLKLQPELKEVFLNIETIVGALLATRFSAESEDTTNTFRAVHDSEIILAGLLELSQEYKQDTALIKADPDSEFFTLQQITLLAWKVVSINQERMGISRDLFGNENTSKLLKP